MWLERRGKESQGSRRGGEGSEGTRPARSLEAPPVVPAGQNVFEGRDGYSLTSGTTYTS